MDMKDERWAWDQATLIAKLAYQEQDPPGDAIKVHEQRRKVLSKQIVRALMDAAVRKREEFIVSASVYHDGVIVSLPAPARHGTILYSMQGAKGGTITDEQQGFLTSTGRFVNRVEAMEIAYRAEQFKTTISETRLFSEDLW